MAGSAIEAVNLGVATLTKELKCNPQALEAAYLSVITFSRHAQQVVPLTELALFQPPKLTVRPGTALGSGLCVLMDCMKREVVRTTATTKGDYRPLVFLLTDGQPTDEWEAAARGITNNRNLKIANIYAIGCGPDVDYSVLHKITDIVFKMPEMTPETFRKFFIWLSASVQSASIGINDAGTTSLPKGVLEIVKDAPSESHSLPRQVFLHAVCIRRRKPYLMRFGFESQMERYVAVAAHQLEDVQAGDESFLPPINSAMLLGCPPCPYCENTSAGVCGCGAIFCSPKSDLSPVICPKCNASLTKGAKEESFDIRRSEG